jgi:ubiquinone biosynthesis protein UbiJ
MLTEHIQSIVDQHVAGSPRARQLLSELDGHRMQVVARHTPWSLSLHAQDQRLLVAMQAAAADATLSGTPMALLALLREDPTDVIRRGEVTIAGDAELAARFQELLQLLRPDLEGVLARVIGDVPAHGAGRLLRKVLDYGRSSVRTTALNAGEYLAHERRVLVPRAEAAQFLQDVDALRERADRIAARVALLEAPRSGA